MKKNNNFVFVYVLICCFLMVGCQSKKSILDTVSPDQIIEDLLSLNQDHKDYIKNKNTLYIPKHYHKLLEKNYRKKFLSPWKATRASISKKTVAVHFQKLSKKQTFGENKQQISDVWIEKINQNANLKGYPNYLRKAVTIANTNLRLLPTHKPVFSAFSDNSNGYPFDNNQNAKLPANTPILITHITRDNAWVLVETPYAFGWVSIRDIAYAGPKFIKSFKSYTKYVSAVKDDFPIKTTSGTYLYQSYIGMGFPLYKETKKNYYVIVARGNASRYAYIEKSVLSKKHVRRRPIPINGKNIGMICDNLINQPYGWGELYFNRDCSAMIRDLFAPFSIWLPRNSRSQAKHGGLFLDISTMSEDQKQEFIIDNGVPYLTLLWFPGHIMLYIGDKNNESLVFHNIWGIRTKDESKRKIIGKAVITTLKPGEELPNIDDSYNFLKRLKGMTLLTPRYN